MTRHGAEESVLVGRFNGPWGVQGWVRVYSYTRPATEIFNYRPWLRGSDGESLSVSQWRQSGQRLVARIEGIDTPEQAAALDRDEIRVPRSSLPETGEGEYYWHDLVGLEVINLQDHHYGRVARLIETGTHDVLEVADEGREDPVLIPFVPDTFIRHVDLEAGRIVVDWPLDWVESP
ncbi:MAG: ribosome maturation factor RimM [Wenzhouxiangella sp.]